MTGALARITRIAELRGGTTQRRLDGSYFTDTDVALHISRRAIGARLLHDAQVADDVVARMLANGLDPIAALVAACADFSVRERVIESMGSLIVLDPTCGAGSFLQAAWLVFREIEEALGTRIVTIGQLRGIDSDEHAAHACRLTLAQVSGEPASSARIQVADAQHAGILPDADIIIGNPPYVRASAGEVQADLFTRSVPNRSAWIVERALAIARPEARVAFVLPISTACTDAFAPARASWDEACGEVLTSHFDTIPATLFSGVVQRLSIFEGRARRSDEQGAARWWTTRYHRWLGDERAGLLDRVRHVPMPISPIGTSIPKVGTELEAELLELLFVHPPAGRLFERTPQGSVRSENRVLYKRRWSYFLLFTDFVPPMWNEDGSERPPSEFKSLDIVAEMDSRVLLAAYSSTLFWWYFSVFTDNRNVNVRDLAAFPIPELDVGHQKQLATLGSELMVALRSCAEVRTCTYRSIGTIRNTYFRQGATRPVIDRIDRVLARAFGMNGEQLEFVLGYERRFRGAQASD